MMLLQIDFWEQAIKGASDVTSAGEFAISALLWSVFLTFILYGRYDISFVTALVASPIVVVGGAVLIFGGLVVLLQVMVAVLVPALVLFFLLTWIPVFGTSSSD